MPTVRFYTNDAVYSNRTRQILRTLQDSTVRRDIVNQTIADAIQPYVPMKSGKLRRSRYVGVNLISWGGGLPYARYQHDGVVFAPNYPIIKGGVVVGWYSPRGKGTKHPTGRELGGRGMWGVGQNANRQNAFWMGWNFGYTTMGTVHHWERMYEWKLKSDTNKEISKQLKAELRRRRGR